MVQNYMESLVDKTLKTELADSAHKYTEICQCPSCLARMKAFALNLLPPFYVTTLAGEVFGQYQSKELQQMSDVLVAVGKALEDARQHPQHPPAVPAGSGY